MRKISTFIVLILLLVVFIGWQGYRYLNTPVSYEEATLIIMSGTPLRMIADQLGRAGVIKYPSLFRLYARFIGADRRIKAGEYQFIGSATPLGILKRFESGDVKLYKVRFVEGWTAFDMASYLNGIDYLSDGYGDDFLDAVKNAGSVEGYLFPETYKVQRFVSPATLVSLMMNEFAKHYTVEFEKRAAEIGMTTHEVVTLASIIEKEAGNAEERPIVSSVFHNRLKKGMFLQADPTVAYGLKNYDGNIRKKDLSNPHEYNTYVHKGLPPGPISNPSLASIKAALWPADTKYLYFVSQNDGTHFFSKTFAEHVNAVNKFQK